MDDFHPEEKGSFGLHRLKKKMPVLNNKKTGIFLMYHF